MVTMNIQTEQEKTLCEILKEENSPLRGISALEVYSAFTLLLGRQPMRDSKGRCLYAHSDMQLILSKSSLETYRLHELEDWKKRLPLARTLGRTDAIKRLVAIGDAGWLSRCIYERGRLLLCESDAEQLCYLRKSGYAERPAWWSA